MLGSRPTQNTWRARLVSCLRSGLSPGGAYLGIPFSMKAARRLCAPWRSCAPRWHSSVGISSPTRSICRWHCGRDVPRNPWRKNEGPMPNVSRGFVKGAAPNWRPCGSWRAGAFIDPSSLTTSSRVSPTAGSVREYTQWRASVCEPRRPIAVAARPNHPDTLTEDAWCERTMAINPARTAG